MDSLPIIYQDDDLIVINKSAGLVVTPAESHSQKTISEILTEDFGIKIDRGGIVHRLDKDTSGILLAVKTVESLESLQKQFQDRTVKKRYTALAHGVVEKEVIVEGAIGRNPGDREKFIVLEEGKEATTKFEPIQCLALSDERLVDIFPDFSKIQYKKLYTNHYTLFTLLHCFPLTGRTHQIRVHLKHIDHPIVGDEKYGGRKTLRLDRRWCPRQFLHASYIEFDHPRTGKRVSFESPLPEDLEKALSYLADNF